MVTLMLLRILYIFCNGLMEIVTYFSGNLIHIMRKSKMVFSILKPAPQTNLDANYLLNNL